MGKVVSKKDESVRMFENPFLEKMSHIHPSLPVIFFVPLITYFAWIGIQQVASREILPAILLGIFIWTFTEYSLHRFVFHYEPQSTFGKKIHFMAHGVHHDYPRDSTRLVLPPAVSVPLALAFRWMFSLFMGHWTDLVFSAFIAGYLAYDMIHYATHHVPMKSRVGRFLKQYHMRHHFADSDTAFGVSNPLWDFVFRTIPKRTEK